MTWETRLAEHVKQEHVYIEAARRTMESEANCALDFAIRVTHRATEIKSLCASLSQPLTIDEVMERIRITTQERLQR